LFWVRVAPTVQNDKGVMKVRDGKCFKFQEQQVGEQVRRLGV